MKTTCVIRAIAMAIVPTFVTINVIGVVLFVFSNQRPRYRHPMAIKSEMAQLVAALEDCRTSLGKGDYPPASTDDPEAVKQFLAKAFPNYHGGLPEKYRNLDAASSLVFWLGGMTDKDGNLIGFSADPKNPFDATSASRFAPFMDFDQKRLRNEGGLLVYLPPNGNSQSDPYVYFRSDAKGKYHGAWKNCRPCRDSGGWVNSRSYQLFSPGKDGKYGSGVQYPDGTDYDAQRMDDMSNFTSGATLGDDMP
jgi:hypothetical protein